MTHGPAHSMACSPPLHSRVSLPSSVTVSETEFVNREDVGNGDYGFVGWCKIPQTHAWKTAFQTRLWADAQWLRAVVRVCIWLVCSSSARDISSVCPLPRLL